MQTSSMRIITVPEDIIIDILLRLSVKSLLRFKSVCKTWYNLIKSPSFISMHHNFGTLSQILVCRSNTRFSFLSNDNSTSMLSPDLEIPTSRGEVNLVGSCNGIVCYYHSLAIFLSNPARREFRQLPPSSIRSDNDSDVVGLGFGFASGSVYDFKVFRVVGGVRGEARTWRAEMFTLSCNTWREIEWGLDDGGVLYLDNRGLFFSNSFHFIAITTTEWRSVEHKSPSGMEFSVVCCDIDTERVKRMDLPLKDGHKRGNLRCLMVVKEFLSVVFTHPPSYSEDKLVDIWIMKDYGVVESWTRLYSIKPYAMGSTPISYFWMEDHVLLLYQYGASRLVRLNLNTLDVESMVIFGMDTQVVVVKESLASIM